MKKNALYCFLLTSVIVLSGCAARENSDLPNAALDGTRGSGSADPGDTSDPQEIGLDDALNIALKHAGLDRDQVVLMRSKLELDDGIREYEIEFTVNSHDYEYSISAVSGEIIKFSLENISLPSGGGSNPEPVSSSDSLQVAERITEAQAKDIALRHAGVSANAVTFTKSKLELDNGVWEYEIEFVSNSREYEYGINAVSGEVIKFESESIPQQSGSVSGGGSDSQQGTERITEAQAKDIALKHAGVSASGVVFKEAKLEMANGVWEYEIEFVSNSREYEYVINAVSGEVIKFESESIPQQSGSGSGANSSSDIPQGTERITEAQAKDIALKHAGVSASEVVFKEVKLEMDNGIWEYEIEFLAGGSEFEYKLNAVTGAVFEWEMDGYSHHCSDSNCCHYPSYHHQQHHH